VTRKSVDEGPFDLLEKRFVFLVSRVFFWVLCGAAAVALVAAIVVLLVNLVPAVKQKVEAPSKPAEISLSQADVEQVLAPQPSSKPDSRAGRAEPPASPSRPAETSKLAVPKDTLDPTLKAKIDTLRALFPSDKYAWESVYGSRPAETDFWGRVTSRETYLAKRGLEYTLGRVLSLYEGTAARVKVVEEATAVMSKFDLDRRGAAFDAWATLRRERETARQRELRVLEARYSADRRSAEARFAEEQNKKARGVKDALRYVGAAFAGIALVGLFLCFLAIERNTRMLKAMMEKNHLA